jgi:hypothetical protein
LLQSVKVEEMVEDSQTPSTVLPWFFFATEFFVDYLGLKLAMHICSPHPGWLRGVGFGLQRLDRTMLAPIQIRSSCIVLVGAKLASVGLVMNVVSFLGGLILSCEQLNIMVNYKGRAQ